MVFFDWDHSNLSQQAIATIKQAADAFKTRGNARITATGHNDTLGPEAYNMALSLRRANAVTDALVRKGVPAQVISARSRRSANRPCSPRPITMPVSEPHHPDAARRPDAARYL